MENTLENQLPINKLTENHIIKKKWKNNHINRSKNYNEDKNRHWFQRIRKNSNRNRRHDIKSQLKQTNDVHVPYIDKMFMSH